MVDLAGQSLKIKLVPAPTSHQLVTAPHWGGRLTSLFPFQACSSACSHSCYAFMSRVALSYLEDSFTHALHNLVPFSGRSPAWGGGGETGASLIPGIWNSCDQAWCYLKWSQGIFFSVGWLKTSLRRFQPN